MHDHRRRSRRARVAQAEHAPHDARGFFSEQTDPVLKAAIEEFERSKTAADLWSDRVACFAGSWRFIGFAVAIMAVWIGANALGHRAWDPYPFVFLNLILSLVAMVQNPIIMMAQNRKESKDRVRAEHSYRVSYATQEDTRAMLTAMETVVAELQELRCQVARRQD